MSTATDTMTNDSGPATQRVAVVTGASSGNGRAIALRLAADGLAVVCADLRPLPRDAGYDGDVAVDAAIRESGGQATFVRCDVADGASMEQLFRQAVATFGRVDVVVANAGIAPYPPVALVDEEFEDFVRVTEVNQHGAWWTCREGARQMIAGGAGGRIVLISSIAGLVGCDSGVHYCMSKGAVTQLTRAITPQLAPHGITVNAVCPGFIDTAMTADELADAETYEHVLRATPLGRPGKPQDVAAAVAFLASEEASWITGIQLPVDGGYTAV